MLLCPQEESRLFGGFIIERLIERFKDRGADEQSQSCSFFYFVGWGLEQALDRI
jgi:hypothetical protein